MKPTCVVHLTRCEGSVQASARLARFLADTLHLPLVDGLGSLAAFTTGATAYLRPHDSFNVIMVNGPVAFCDFRDELGEQLLKHTARLLWVQQDYTITLPPHHSYSRPTKAETPFRRWFHCIPEVSCWTTCIDTLDRRHTDNVPGWPLDQYINFNALTYAPFGMDPDGDPPTYPGALFYYGALREGRLGNLSRLLALSGAAEWRIGSNEGAALSPSNLRVRAQSYVGAGQATPVVIGNAVVFPAGRGGHIRELGYNSDAGGYVTGDLSLKAPHLFDNFDIVDMAYQRCPMPVVWSVSTTGLLLGLTYVPEQQVGAWHWHDTGASGAFESVCVIPEGEEDALYAVVRRTINGAEVRYVERMASRTFIDLSDAFFVDAGGTYSGAATTTITGLTWLEGQTVAVLADGAEHPRRVVTGGAIALDWPASKVHVGIPIEADMMTLPVAVEAQAYGQGRVKNVNRVWMRVHRSGGIMAGPEFNRLTELKWRPIAITPNESQFLETRQFQRSEIAMWFRIPPHMIGDTTKTTSWGTGLEQQSIGFVTYTLRPWLTCIEQALSMLLPRGQFALFNANGLLRGDVKSRWEAYRIGRDTGVYSVNDLRALENLPPVEGGDGRLQPLNFVPLGYEPPEQPVPSEPTDPIDPQPEPEPAQDEESYAEEDDGEDEE